VGQLKVGVESPKAQRTAILAGGSGFVGSHLIRLLLDAPEYTRVYAISRRPLPVEHPKLANRILPLEEARAKLVSVSCQDAYCCIGTRNPKGSAESVRGVELDLIVSFARAVQGMGATRFVVVSAAAANPGSRNIFLRTKGELESALRDLRFASLDILQPGPILGIRPEVRLADLAATVFMPLINPLLRGGQAPRRAISGRDLARAMLGAARSQRRGVYTYAGEPLARLAAAGVRAPF
jgi:uncharacterized protein YbjT (DUF2867 family)